MWHPVSAHLLPLAVSTRSNIALHAAGGYSQRGEMHPCGKCLPSASNEDFTCFSVLFFFLTWRLMLISVFSVSEVSVSTWISFAQGSIISVRLLYPLF